MVEVMNKDCWTWTEINCNPIKIYDGICKECIGEGVVYTQDFLDGKVDEYDPDYNNKVAVVCSPCNGSGNK